MERSTNRTRGVFEARTKKKIEGHIEVPEGVAAEGIQTGEKKSDESKTHAAQDTGGGCTWGTRFKDLPRRTSSVDKGDWGLQTDEGNNSVRYNKRQKLKKNTMSRK